MLIEFLILLILVTRYRHGHTSPCFTDVVVFCKTRRPTSKKHNLLYVVLALWWWAGPEPAVFLRSAHIWQVLCHFISGEKLQVLYKISLGLSGRFASFYVLV